MNLVEELRYSFETMLPGKREKHEALLGVAIGVAGLVSAVLVEGATNNHESASFTAMGVSVLSVAVAAPLANKRT